VQSAVQQFRTIEAIVAHDIDANLLALMRGRVAWLLLQGPAPADPVDGRERAVVDFLDQFVIDVAGFCGAQRTAFFGAVGADALAIVQAIFVVDVGTRLTIVRERLFGETASVASVDVVAGVELWPALEELMRSVALLDALDPLTSELVRLYGAAQHRCRVCQSRRSVNAVDAAPHADLLAVAERFESADLDERSKTALRLTQRMLAQPAEIDAALAAAANERFSRDELDELLLKVVRNAANKIAVAFGADAAAVAEGVEYFTIDAHGDVFAAVDPATVRAHR
jgi:alkylhydroperoxidase family enzyme